MKIDTALPEVKVIIPLDVRMDLNIKPGQSLVAMTWGDHIVLVPQRPIDEIQALFKSKANDFEREKDREL
jgi:bifunctional DNA-binding transcriptional regulator/antitoxin component of YhaV-PrlF toxin-antitoxin module